MKRIICLILTIVVLLLLGLAPESPAKSYFMLVPSTYENIFPKLDAKKIGLVNESPYHGIAVRVISEFDDNPLDFETLKSQAVAIRKRAIKAVWPWDLLLTLRFVSGGEEVGPGYCSRSLEKLQSKIKRRSKTFALLLAKYSCLALGGTIASWNDRQAKKGWTARTCGQSDLKNLKDSSPFIGAMAANYDYQRIYGTLMAGYEPFDNRPSVSCRVGEDFPGIPWQSQHRASIYSLLAGGNSEP